MKLGRVAEAAPGGFRARLVAVFPEAGHVVDLEVAETLRLMRRGATRAAGERLARALFPSSMAQALAAGDAFLEACREAVATADPAAQKNLGEVTWLAPLDPLLIRDCLLFEEHLEHAYSGLGLAIPPGFYEAPPYYKGNPASVIGHDQEVRWPAYTQEMDYELELGLVTWRRGTNLDPESASALLFGVTAVNDFSARDVQRREMELRLGPYKSKDFATALGPWITTADELDVDRLEMVARVNGEEWSRGNSGAMMLKAAEILAFVSNGETVGPGELIGSGTVGGGCGLELGRRLSPGDEVEVEIEGVGRLRNRLGRPETEGWSPGQRRQMP